MIRKFILLLAVASIGITSCKKGDISAAAASTPGSDITPSAETVETTPSNSKFPVMKFDKTEHDFGTITMGETVDYTFTFENTGEADLIITEAKGSCGCTVPEFPKDPIKPGQKSEMKVSFSSAGKRGMQNKTVTIHTNTQAGVETLTVKTNIIDPAATN